jgi:hypothetical protein
VVTKLTDLILPAVAVVGGYIVISRVTGWDPIGRAGYDIQKTLGDWWNSLFTSTKGYLVFSHDSRRQGETFSIAVNGLKPNQPFIYGWRELGFSLQVTAPATGEWIQQIVVSYDTAPGVYTIYIDQRAAGGPYGERRFTVL